MNSASKLPLFYAYLFFIIAFLLFLVAGEQLMPRWLSITLGIISSLFFLSCLRRSKPYLYKCNFWKCFIILSGSSGAFVYFNLNGPEILTSFFGSVMVFNFITFFFYRMIADFSDIEADLRLRDQLDTFTLETPEKETSLDSFFSNVNPGSKEEQKKIMRENSIGQTARFVGDAFYSWAQKYNLEINKNDKKNSVQNDVEKVALHAIETRFVIEGDHLHKHQILEEYSKSPNNGLIDLVISILKVEAELHLNEKDDIESFIEVIFEELRGKHISSAMIFGHEGLNFKNTLKSLSNFALSHPSNEKEPKNYNVNQKKEFGSNSKSKTYFNVIQLQIMMSLIGVRELTEDQKITLAIFFDCFKVIFLGSEFEKGLLSENDILSQTMQLSNLNKKITDRHFDKARYLVHELRDKKAIEIVNKTSSFCEEIYIGNVKKPFLKKLIENSEYQWNFD